MSCSQPCAVRRQPSSIVAGAGDRNTGTEAAKSAVAAVSARRRNITSLPSARLLHEIRTMLPVNARAAPGVPAILVAAPQSIALITLRGGCGCHKHRSICCLQATHAYGTVLYLQPLFQGNDSLSPSSRKPFAMPQLVAYFSRCKERVAGVCLPRAAAMHPPAAKDLARNGTTFL